ncbi:recombinase family protein [Sphingomonas sp. QA11]|uniref:recombinase family protein n=1 Tax=Sphingomonas sp. QA11 TaxID=2950605 RepID=UPI00234A6ACE|nr:recombinase family protein [Sphingomonas sp. QA11]WCM25852.1 recombinase family protein [Sphingomonas sp. QA11]
MTRAALYARYSSDQQSASSIDDQLRICREQAAREDWQVVGIYKDAAISGASVSLRPGIQALLQDAQAGKFDVVLAEALDRVSRDQADVATLYKHLQFAGVKIVTLAEGEISELHVGLKGTMNALFLKDLANKTRRGLRGRIEKGKAGGGLCYGYDVLKRLDLNGEPVRGERTINAAEAEAVRHIFPDFANGLSPQAIIERLNAGGIAGPGGKLWSATTIRGHVKRGTGLLNNELYIGKLVWNRQRYIKDPRTGKRVSRVNPASEWITTDVPELRIIDDALWQAVKARQEIITTQFANAIAATRASFQLNATHRPKSLLSGLVSCGCCGGPYALRLKARFACSNRVDTRSCDNGHSITRTELEARVLDGLRDKLMAPDIAAEAVRAYVDETNRLNHQRRAASTADKADMERVSKAIRGLVTMVEDGQGTRTLIERLRDLESQEDAIRARTDAAPIDAPDIHPNIAEIYRKKVERLAEALNHPAERDEAADAIRGLIERVTLTPGAKRGEVNAVLHGEFGTILEWMERRGDGAGAKTATALAGGPERAVMRSMVAGTRNQRYRRNKSGDPEGSPVSLVAGAHNQRCLRNSFTRLFEMHIPKLTAGLR